MAPPTAAKPLLTAQRYAEYVGGDRVKIVVGPEAKTFDLSRDMLAWASPMMNGAFNGDFKEAHDGVLVLEDVTVKSFELALTVIFCIDARFIKFDANNFADMTDCISTMIDLASLGQKLIMPALDRMAASCIRTVLLNDNTPLKSEHIIQAYELLADNSESREAIVRIAFYHFQQDDWNAETGDLRNWKFFDATAAVPAFGQALLVRAKNLMDGITST